MMRSTRMLLPALALVLAGFVDTASAQQLTGAFLFGSRNLDCPVTNDGGETSYTMVHHVNGQPETIEYTGEKGHGFEVITDDLEGRNGFARFGPFDDSANNRNRFGDTCPDELYDSFIGFKNFETPCNAETEGDPQAACSPPEGGVFRVDVPPGIYRFVAVMGEADNPHASRLLAENGGSGGPENISVNHVVLVANHDQAQYVSDPPVREDRLGAGVFAAVGFDGKIPPTSDAAVVPSFINQGPDGRPTVDNAPPSSPFLAVTEQNGQSYIRFHCLQANANPGPGGSGVVDGIGNPDPNGGDIVLLEVWKVADLPEVPDASLAGYAFLVSLALLMGFVLIRRVA